MPTAYADRDDLAAYLEDGLPEGYANDYFDRVLELASADVDRWCTAVGQDADAPLKFATEVDPIVWEDVPAGFDRLKQAIINATCAQAEYRLARGDQFFVEPQRREGEFANAQVRQPRFGPKAVEELRTAGYRLRLTTARMI